MADRFLKHVPSGQIFIFAPPFNSHDDFVEVADAQGTPLEVEPEVNPAPRKRKSNAAADTATAADVALSADASRGV
jgi:hypothetical protein